MSITPFTFVDQEGNIHSWISGSGGPALPAEDTLPDMQLAKDLRGFTHPNLHRRIDAADPNDPKYTSLHYVVDETLYANNQADPGDIAHFLDGEVSARSYELTIGGVHSYRTTHYNTHDEESRTSEIP